jgi:hypothetical protein
LVLLGFSYGIPILLASLCYEPYGKAIEVTQKEGDLFPSGMIFFVGRVGPQALDSGVTSH